VEKMPFPPKEYVEKMPFKSLPPKGESKKKKKKKKKKRIKRREDMISSLKLYVTTQDFIKFWGKIFAFVLLEMNGNSQGFKNFLSLFERFIGKLL
jgi:hypothetical protein